jgi:nicotinamide riboside kinase
MATSPRAHAYLVCSEEIPWEADPLRENPHDRARLTNVILEKIQTLKRPYILLRGSIEERETQAIDFIQRQGF